MPKSKYNYEIVWPAEYVAYHATVTKEMEGIQKRLREINVALDKHAFQMAKLEKQYDIVRSTQANLDDTIRYANEGLRRTMKECLQETAGGIEREVAQNLEGNVDSFLHDLFHKLANFVELIGAKTGLFVDVYDDHQMEHLAEHKQEEKEQQVKALKQIFKPKPLSALSPLVKQRVVKYSSLSGEEGLDQVDAPLAAATSDDSVASSTSSCERQHGSVDEDVVVNCECEKEGGECHDAKCHNNFAWDGAKAYKFVKPNSKKSEHV